VSVQGTGNTFKLRVNLVQVQVIVRGNAGKPVEGCTKKISGAISLPLPSGPRNRNSQALVWQLVRGDGLKLAGIALCK
jgi:hypothetical protein